MLKVSLSNTFSKVLIHVSCCILNMMRELLMDLTLSFNNALSAFLTMYLPLGVLMLLFSLTLTGLMSLLRHLRENLWWFQNLPSYIPISPSV